jgi:hypothetical protein
VRKLSRTTQPASAMSRPQRAAGPHHTRLADVRLPARLVSLLISCGIQSQAMAPLRNYSPTSAGDGLVHPTDRLLALSSSLCLSVRLIPSSQHPTRSPPGSRAPSPAAAASTSGSSTAPLTAYEHIPTPLPRRAQRLPVLD